MSDNQDVAVTLADEFIGLAERVLEHGETSVKAVDCAIQDDLGFNYGRMQSEHLPSDYDRLHAKLVAAMFNDLPTILDALRQPTTDRPDAGERAAVVRWLREQADKGAEYGIASDKGTTRRAAFGGGSLALDRAATEIEQGAHLNAAGVAEQIAAGLTEIQRLMLLDGYACGMADEMVSLGLWAPDQKLGPAYFLLTPLGREVRAILAALKPTEPAPEVEGLVGARGKLTPEYLAMTPLQKWETLALHGLLGTDEPWIEDMRDHLTRLQAENARLEALLGEAREALRSIRDDRNFTSAKSRAEITLATLNGGQSDG